MVNAVEGLGYTELMNLHFDEFLEVRKVVVSISDKRRQEVRSMSRA